MFFTSGTTNAQNSCTCSTPDGSASSPAATDADTLENSCVPDDAHVVWSVALVLLCVNWSVGEVSVKNFATRRCWCSSVIFDKKLNIPLCRRFQRINVRVFHCLNFSTICRNKDVFSILSRALRAMKLLVLVRIPMILMFTAYESLRFIEIR